VKTAEEWAARADELGEMYADCPEDAWRNALEYERRIEALENGIKWAVPVMEQFDWIKYDLAEDFEPFKALVS
jgi:hypothetical protein